MSSAPPGRKTRAASTTSSESLLLLRTKGTADCFLFCFLTKARSARTKQHSPNTHKPGSSEWPATNEHSEFLFFPEWARITENQARHRDSRGGNQYHLDLGRIRWARSRWESPENPLIVCTTTCFGPGPQSRYNTSLPLECPLC